MRAVLVVVVLFATLEASAQPFHDYSQAHPVPASWTKPTFKLSQTYPQSAPAPATVQSHPWLGIDFRTDWRGYMAAILKYSLEGNVERDWQDVGQNPVRPWFHVPALDVDTCSGREFIRGMTMERYSRPFGLHRNQTQPANNWAVGMYNEHGGFVIGQVWPLQGPPQFATIDFPLGSLSTKLLFTTATDAQVPFLENSLTWDAHIYTQPGRPCPSQQRQVAPLRLLQVDVAVRDDRAGPTGWVFGTFIYSAAAPGATPYDRLVPVGLMWGDDPGVFSRRNDLGSYVNSDLKESILNPDLVEKTGHDYGKHAYQTHFGLGGRLNGPVDNPVSSCMSCHGRGKQPRQPLFLSKTVDKITTADVTAFFQNILQGHAGGHLDYSLQLFQSVENCPNGDDVCRVDVNIPALLSMLESQKFITLKQPWPTLPKAGERSPSPSVGPIGFRESADDRAPTASPSRGPELAKKPGATAPTSATATARFSSKAYMVIGALALLTFGLGFLIGKRRT